MARPVKNINDLSPERLRKLKPYEIQERKFQEQQSQVNKEISEIKTNRITTKGISKYLKQIKSINSDNIQLDSLIAIQPLISELQYTEEVLTQIKNAIDTHGIIDVYGRPSQLISLYDKLSTKKLTIVEKLNNILKETKSNNNTNSYINPTPADLDMLISKYTSKKGA